MESADDLSYECVERWTNKFSNNDYRLLWEGNYYDSDVHDYAELSTETFSKLVCKCVNVFGEYGVTKDTRIAFYLPALIQLPIAALAAIRIGAPFLPISAMDEDVDKLGALLNKSECEVVISVDGFWSGTHLVRTKHILDQALTSLHNNCRRVMVVRHLTPNEGVPPPQRHIVARRPYYLYKVNMQEGRDLWWSTLFACASTECKTTTLDENATAILQSVWNDQGVALVTSSRLELRKEVENLAHRIDSTGVCFVMCTQDACTAVVAILAAFYSSAQVLIFEGIASYPDCSRISQIINKYEAKTIIISESDLVTLLDNEEYARMWSTATLTKIIVIGGQATAARASVLFGVPSENVIPPLQRTNNDQTLK